MNNAIIRRYERTYSLDNLSFCPGNVKRSTQYHNAQSDAFDKYIDGEYEESMILFYKALLLRCNNVTYHNKSCSGHLQAISFLSYCMDIVIDDCGETTTLIRWLRDEADYKISDVCSMFYDFLDTMVNDRQKNGMRFIGDLGLARERRTARRGKTYTLRINRK